MSQFLQLFWGSSIRKKKPLLIICTCVLLANAPTKASHIVGGEFAVTWVSGNTYQVTLNFYRDCLNGQAYFDSPITVGIYDLVTNANQQCFSMTLTDTSTLTLGDGCYTPSSLCVQRGTYIADVTIPTNSDGYYISWGRCCRNAIITNLSNPSSAGEEWYAEFPDPSLHNSTPVFASYPTAYWCAGEINISNLSATDPDGDSLVYSLLTPLNGNTNSTTVISSCPDAGSYSSVAWQSPYSATSMIGTTSTLYINAANGFITVNPANLGVFVICVVVKEYSRSDGKYLGQVRRDIQYDVLACTAVAAYPDTTVCAAGSHVQMNASGGTSYSWSPSTGLTNPNISNPIASPSVSTTYSVSVTSSGGCTATTTVAISVNSLPIITGSSASVCNGQSISLNAGGGSTYSWSPLTGLSPTTGATVSASPSVTTTYTITGTDIYGCSNTKSLTLTVNSSPTAGISSPVSICSGNSTPLTASGGGTYSWNPGGATTSSISVSPASSITYTATVTGGNGCTATATTTVTVSSPSVGITGATGTICSGTSLALSASGGGTYLWSPGGATTSSVSVSPSTTTTYTVNVTSGCGSGSSTYTVNVNTSPSAGVSGTTGTICSGSSSTLNASGGGTYVWGPSTGLSGTTGTTESATPTTSTTYTVTVTGANGCTATAITTVNVSSITAGVSGVTGVCSGSSASLTATGGAGGTYLWSPGGATTSSINASTAGTYTVTETNACGSAKGTATLNVNSLPSAGVSGVTGFTGTICNGSSTSLNASGGSTYTWGPSTGLSATSGTTVSANPTTTTTYTVIATGSDGCTATANITVTVDVTSGAVSAVEPICSGSSTLLDASGGVSYAWGPSTGLSGTSGTTVSAHPTTTTTYTVTVTNANGCTATATTTVTVNSVPPAPTITESVTGDTLYSSTNVSYVSYQWYRNDTILTGQTKDTLVIGSTNANFEVLVNSSDGCTDSATSTFSNRTLPIELVSFDAVYNGKTVDLDWSTASEINNDFFAVERTKDGIGFVPIAIIKGAGTSTSLLYYHTVDDNPLFGVSAYRLKQTDFDGRYHYSRMVAVVVKSNGNLEILSLNKNPTDNSFQYLIFSPGGKPVNIEIADLLGRVIMTKTSVGNIGTIDFSEAIRGTYFFKVFNDSESSVKKFVY